MLISPNVRKPCAAPVPLIVINQLTMSNWTLKLSGSNSCPPPDVIPGSYLTASIWTNVTKVLNYSGSGGISGSGIGYVSPFPRPNVGDAPDCSDYFGNVCGYNGSDMPCGIPQTWELNTGSAQVVIKSGIYSNGYVTSSVTESIFNPDYGFKVIFSNKAWHGVLKYTSRQYNAPDSFDACGECVWHNDDTGNNETIRYLTMDGVCNVTRYGIDGVTVEDTGYGSFTTNINRYSGDYDVTNCYSSSTDGDGYYATVAMDNIGGVGGNCTNVYGKYLYNYGQNNMNYGLPMSITGSGGNWTVVWLDSYYPDGITQTFFTASILTINGYYSTTNIIYGAFYGLDGGIYLGTRFSETLSFSDTTYSYVSYFSAESIIYGGTTVVNVTGNLTNPYTVYDVQTDLIYLAGQSRLGDDRLYQWRTDGNLQAGPLINYSEFANNSLAPMCDYTRNPTVDGSVRGKLMPAGYGAFWQPDFENWNTCPDTIDEHIIKYINTYGEYSSAWPVPNATQWVDLQTSTQLIQGAFNGNGFFWTVDGQNVKDTVMWMARYAEKVIQKNSMNFARPCGQDRLSVDPTTARCINNITTHTLNLEPSGVATTIINGQTCWVCGTGIVDGLWTVSVVDGYTINLNTLLGSASMFPLPPFSNCGSGIIGAVKYPSAAGLCGRTLITNCTNTNPVTCSLADDTWLISGDKVIVTNSSGSMSSILNGSWTIGVLNSSMITLTGCNTTGSSIYAGEGQLFVSGAIDWSLNNSKPEGDYTSVTWTNNFRDVGEYNRLTALCTSNVSGITCCQTTTNDCMGATATCGCGTVPSSPRPFLAAYGLPQSITGVTCNQNCYNITNNCLGTTIAYHSPIDEGFGKNGTNLGWQWATQDTQYGSMVNMLIKQYQVDPLAVAPPCMCQEVADSSPTVYDCSTCQTVVDDGTCLDNQADLTCINYYAKPAFYESRCYPLSGSNTTYNGLIGCLSFSDMSSSFGGTACSPPNNFGATNTSGFVSSISYPPYWVTLINEATCICNGGQFSGDYQAYGIDCLDATSPPP